MPPREIPLDLVSAYTGQSLTREAAFPAAEYVERLARMRGAMARAGLDFALVHNMANLCYLTGHQTPMADWYNCLLVPASGELTLQVCDAGLAVVHTQGVGKLVWVRWDTMSGGAARQTVELLGQYDLTGKRVGLEMRRPGVDPFACEVFRTSFPETEFVDATELVLRLRAVKSPAEIACLREAARITVAGITSALGAIKPGVTENDIAAAGSEAMIRAGSEFFSIEPFVRTGARAAMAHATYKRTPVRAGDAVILEFGGVYQRYSAPLYRTAVVGRPSERLQRLSDICLETLNRLYGNIRPGRTMHDVAEATVKALETVESDTEVNPHHGYSVGIGFPPDWVEHSMFIRRGAEDVLQPGMTFHTPRALRIPGLTSAGFSETILVTDTGCEPLTNHPRELCVI